MAPKLNFGGFSYQISTWKEFWKLDYCSLSRWTGSCGTPGRLQWCTDLLLNFLNNKIIEFYFNDKNIELYLLLIKEPTSGLDAALALQVMTTLRSYAADQNKTIVTTIHQPSSQIFHMFQNVLLLADGQVISWHKCSMYVPPNPYTLHFEYPTPPLIPYLLTNPTLSKTLPHYLATNTLPPEYPIPSDTLSPQITLSSQMPYLPGKDMGPERNLAPNLPPYKQIKRHLWKH